MNFAFLFDYEFEKSKQEGNSIVLKTGNKKLGKELFDKERKKKKGCC